MRPPDAPAGEGSARVVIRLAGTVQGVGFRYFARREAMRLDVTGWVANLPDGSVEAVGEGDRRSLERFVERLSVGPPGGHVTDVELRWESAIGEFVGFGIRSGWHPGD